MKFAGWDILLLHRYFTPAGILTPLAPGGMDDIAKDLWP
jgi:hypothetical protein